MADSKPKQAAPDATRLMRWAIVGSVLIAACAIGVMGWQLWPRTDRFYTDADTIREPLGTAYVRDVLWKPPQRLDGSLNSDLDDYEARISADGLSMFFVRGKAGENADIYHAQRTSAGWSDPAPVASINSEYDELGPAPSHDGSVLYFYSDRPGGHGKYDLWAAYRADDGRSGYADPINLGPGVNSRFSDYGPAVTPDGERLYFASNRPDESDAGPKPDAWRATIREDLYVRDYDLYAAEISDRGVSAAVPVVALNSPYNDGAPSVSPVGDFLYFASDRPEGQGGFDLYRTRLLPSGAMNPVNLGDAVNTPANELDPAIGMGGFALYFSSNRSAPTNEAKETTPSVVAGDALGRDPTHSEPVATKSRDYDLYFTTSREVFADARVTYATIDWVGIWDRIGTTLLLALLALLLLLTLLALIGNLRSRRLSLLVRCLLGSMLAHLLLLLLLTLWHVSAGLVDAKGRGGQVHITLAPPSAGDGLTAQIRGEFAAVEAPPAPQQEVQRTEPVVLASAPVVHATLPVAPTQFAPAQPLTMPVELTDAAAESQMTQTVPSPQSYSVDAPSEPIAIPAAQLPVRTAEAVDAPQEEPPPEAQSEHAAKVESQQSITPSQIPQQLVEVNPAVASANSRSDAGEASLADQLQIAERMPASDLANDPPTSELTLTDPPTATAPLEFNADLEELTPRADHANAADEQESAAPSAVPAPTTRAAAPALTDAAATLDDVLSRFTIEPVSSTGGQNARSLAEPTDVLGRVASTTPTADNTLAFGETVVDPVLPDAPAFDVALPAEARPNAAPSAVETDTVAAEPARSRARAEPFVHEASGPDARVVQMDIQLLSVNDADGDASTSSLARAETANLADSALAATSWSWRRADDVPEIKPLELSLPTHLPVDAPDPDDPYAQRSQESRLGLVVEKGGSDKTERAVELALKWLAAHQSGDGHWDGASFDNRCGACGGDTEYDVHVGLTGLATLCFLAADHTQVKPGPYQDNVRRALRWLRERQSGDGDLRAGETMYSHGIATIALAEALGMTEDESLAAPVSRAVSFIDRARNREIGGWRYDPGQAGDTSVLGWQMMALKSARLAGVSVPWDNFDETRRWMDLVSTQSHRGLYAYKPGGPPTPSMTAEGMFVQQILGRQPNDLRMQESAEFVLQQLPILWGPDANTYSWYYSTLALFQHGGDAWREWNRALTTALLGAQRRDGKATGSWDPIGEWAHIGGRVYQTALCTLMLEVYYRYLPMYGDQMPADAIGTIRGHVRDAESGAGIAEASVKLDLPNRDPVVVHTGEDGSYELFPPEVPDFFALSASADGHLPSSLNVATSMVMGSVLDLDFTLHPRDGTVIAIEAVPEVHHLGDNSFSGRINSQFQKEAEGSVYRRAFTLPVVLAESGASRVQLSLLAKGVQEDHRIVINGVELDDVLDDAPSDGSFGEWTTEFDADKLRSGENLFEIYAGSRGSDVDDFEFVNVQFRMLP